MYIYIYKALCRHPAPCPAPGACSRLSPRRRAGRTKSLYIHVYIYIYT